MVKQWGLVAFFIYYNTFYLVYKILLHPLWFIANKPVFTFQVSQPDPKYLTV